jgi:subtilase-type serine protease
LTDTGPGIFFLEGANTYSGATTINDGMMIVSAGALPGGSVVTVAAGAVLSLNSDDSIATLEVQGAVYLAGGSTLTVAGDLNNEGSVTLEADGAGGGIIHVGGNFTQGSGASLMVQLGGAPASGQFGRLIVTGTANLAGTLIVQLSSDAPAPGDVFAILTDAARSGDFDSENLPAGSVWDPNATTVRFS